MPRRDGDKKAPTPTVPRRMGRPVGSNSTRPLLLAAKQLFLERGFDGVNLERVARAAGVSRQTVYNLFGSKEALFRAMVKLHWGTVARDSGAALAAGVAVTPGPASVLRGFGEAIVRFIAETEQVAFTRLVISESHSRPWVAEEFYRLGKQPLLQGLVACLQRLDGDGLIACGQPLVAAHQFFGMIQEMVIWPHVMAIGPAANELPPASLVIEEAVLTFLSRYGRGGHARDAATPYRQIQRPNQPKRGAPKRGAKFS